MSIKDGGPAFPRSITAMHGDCHAVEERLSTGVSKRELAAMLAMQGFISRCSPEDIAGNEGHIAVTAVILADALLEALAAKEAK